MQINNTGKSLILIFIIMYGCFFCSKHKSDRNGEISELNKKVDEYMNRLMKADLIPGVALAIIKNGKVITERYYGSASIQHNVKIDSKKMFFIHSTSKIFANIGVFQLIEKDKISFEDPISSILISFQ